MKHLFNSLKKRANRDYIGRTFLQAKGSLGLGPEAGVRKRLREISQKSDSTGSGTREYWQLYHAVRRTRPKFILECGSGVTTVVIACALLENRREGAPGKLVSMEENEFYHSQLATLLTPEEKEVVELILSEVVENSYGARVGRSYAKRPPHPYEIVLVDGPTVPHQEGYFNSDYLEVVRNSPIKVMGLMEGRRFTRKALGEYLQAAGPWDMRHPLPRMFASQNDINQTIAS